MTTRLGTRILLCSTLCSAVWAQDFRPLDVKTGEWASTINGQTTGLPPIPDEVLNRLTPEQRARMQASMQSKGSKTTVSKSCLTKDKLDKPFNLGDENTKSCTRTLVESSRTKQEIRINCDREGMKSTGTVKVEAINAETVKGSMQLAVTNGEHTMNMNYTFASKWVAPTCSDK